MAKKNIKDAAKIGKPKKQVKATFAECKAEDPMTCRFHGVSYLKSLLGGMMKDKDGNPVPHKVEKVKNGYKVTAFYGYNPADAFGQVKKAVEDKGWSVSYGLDSDGNYNINIYKDSSFKFISPEDEADLVDANDAPDAKGDSADDADDLNPNEGIESGVTDAEIADFFKQQGYTNADIKGFDKDFYDNWHKLIAQGVGVSGDPLGEGAIESLEEMMKIAGANHPVSLACAKMLAKLKGEPEPDPKEEAEQKEIEALKEQLNKLMEKAYDYGLSTKPNYSSMFGNITKWMKQEHKKDGWKGLIGLAKNMLGDYRKEVIAETAKKAKAAAEQQENEKYEDFPPPLTEEDFKEFIGEGHSGWTFNSEQEKKNALAIWNAIATTGKMYNGDDLPPHVKEWWTKRASEVPDNPVAKAWAKANAKLMQGGGETQTPSANNAFNGLYDDENKQLDAELGDIDDFLQEGLTDEDQANLGEMDDLLEGELGSGETVEPHQSVNAEVSEELLKPLEHNSSLFPPDITREEITAAIAKGKPLGGASGENATKVTIRGNTYVVKGGKGSHAEHLKNEVHADRAYRAGGVRAPDCELYEFGDGQVYKLAEFVKGTSLAAYMSSATEEQKKAVRADLLKGFPLDVLFSNWDVIGTSRDNILVDEQGNTWRIDNGGSFSMAAMSNHKSMAWGVQHFKGKADFENWEKEGGWEKRQWIDDFKTMRLDPKNKGLFDGYSTADIFLSAGNIDYNKVMDSLPSDLQVALEKPTFEMKQMATHAVSADISGIKNNEMLSSSLDAMYEASKQGFRELCIGDISFSQGGIGSKKSTKGQIPPYPVAKPDPPEDPNQKFAKGAKLDNAAYTGDKVSMIILKAAKSINYHAGFVQKDANGVALGSGSVSSTIDYTPNAGTMEEFKRLDREKIAELAKTDPAAKNILNYYDSVALSMANGYKLPVQEVKIETITSTLPKGFETQEEKDWKAKKSAVLDQYQKDLDHYNQVTLPDYMKDKKDWEDKEKKKLASGQTGLQGNFYDIANEFMEASYGTMGMPTHSGESIDFIEKGKYQNKYGEGVSGSYTQNDSWCPASSRLKVLDLLMRGMSIDDIINIKDNDPLINNGHWSPGPAKKWFMTEAKALKSDPALMSRLMRGYAIFKGLQVMKLENEKAPVKMPDGSTFQVIDHSTHTVGLARKEAYNNAKINSVAPIEQKGANTSCGFESNGCLNPYAYCYDVPLWNIGFTYSDENHQGSKVSSYKGSEHEWVATLIGLTPFRISESVAAEKNLALARENPQIKKERAKRASRLAPFLTSMADWLAKKVKGSK